MIQVWGRRSSSNVQALMWGIAELACADAGAKAADCVSTNLRLQGHAVERIDAGFTYGVNDTDAYLALNPNGTVPTLQIDDEPPLWETAAILRHLANRFGQAPIWPADELSRAHIDRWAEWAKINIALGFTSPVFWPLVRMPAARRDAAAIQEAVDQLHRKLAIAEVQLSQYRYLAGDDFSLADIQFGHCLYRYFDVDIERADLPNLYQYYQRLVARMPFAEHVMVSYEELVDSF